MKGLFQYDVFISYSSADRPWVAELASELTREGFNVFYDRLSIQPGEPWEPKIRTALRQSAASIVVLSPEAIKSGWVTAECTVLFRQAWEEGRPLIPILYRDLPDSELPLFIEPFQYIDFRDSHVRQTALKQLVRALEGEPPDPRSNWPRVRFWQRPWVPIRLVLLLLLTLSLAGLGGVSFVSQAKERKNLTRIPAIPAEPPSPVITGSAALAFRKHRCENTP